MRNIYSGSMVKSAKISKALIGAALLSPIPLVMQYKANKAGNDKPDFHKRHAQAALANSAITGLGAIGLHRTGFGTIPTTLMGGMSGLNLGLAGIHGAVHHLKNSKEYKTLLKKKTASYSYFLDEALYKSGI